MIKNFLHKWRSKNIVLRILFLILLIWYTVSVVIFTGSLLSLKGIETFIRIIIISILYLHLVIYLICGLVLLFTKKKRLFVLLILTLLYSPILNVGSYYINKTYNIIDTTQKEKLEYTSVMISLNETTEYNKIGIISDEKDPTGYIIPQDMIKKFDIKGELVKYDDYIEMTTDLYDGEIDAMFITKGYVARFDSYEKFEKINDETKIVYELSKELENTDNISYSTKKLTEPFTVLLMGVDSEGKSITSGSSFNGDTLMLITFNPRTLNATIFSIPRDTYVPISCNGNKENKINSAAYGGTTCVVKTIENLTNIKIDYYVKVNFMGVVKIVDDLGGVDVDVPISFCEQDSQRRFGEYEICLKKGPQTLNGEQALAFARHRKTLPTGDFQRVQHQQMVVEAMVKKLKTIRNVDDFYTILEDVADNIDTNMTNEQILSLYDVAKDVLVNSVKDQETLSIQKTNLTGYDLTMYIPSYKQFIYTFQYYRESLKEITTLMEENLEIIKPTTIKTFSFDVNDPYESKIAGKGHYTEDKRELLPNFVTKDKNYALEWADARGILLEIEEEKSAKPDGIILSQSVHNGTLVTPSMSLKITVSLHDPALDTQQAEESDNDSVPNFIGETLTSYNKWKNKLSNANIIFEEKELTPDDLLELNRTLYENNKIYKQSSPAGTKLDNITKFTVYYYKQNEE